MKRLSGSKTLMLKALERLVSLPRPMKVALLVSADGMICVAAVLIVFSLRLGEWHLWNLPIAVFGAVAIGSWLPTFAISGIYLSVARFIGSRTIFRIGASCCVIMAVLVATFGLVGFEGVPRTVSIIYPLVFGALLVVNRLTIRYVLYDLLNQKNGHAPQSRVLIYGAGASGRQLAASLRHEPMMVMRGFIDDDVRLAGQHLDGAKVYRSDHVNQCIERLEIDTILLAMPTLTRSARSRIVSMFEGSKVRVLTLPNMQQLLDGEVSVNDLREIEVQDLLGRDPVPPDTSLLARTVRNRTVMVTGAGGSIGSELCRQISKLDPTRIILVEMTEHALYAINSELHLLAETGELSAEIEIVTEMGNVTDSATVDRLFARWQPQTVFHAAAYKHVPLVEDNMIAGLWNNVFGTLHCARAAEREGVRNFILISTDKAVRPTNVMGASKRICELILQALAANGSNTTFAMVRFGNVLGSSGSVVPLFKRQIRAGGPVTLTHADITRYFMTIPEAAQLVIQAGAMAAGGEVYVLDMGAPVRIYDLAKTMIHLSGLTVRDEVNPDGDIDIVETGLRPGEKLYEELLIGDNAQPTSHPRICQALEDHLNWSELKPQLTALQSHLHTGNADAAFTILRQLVPEYRLTGISTAATGKLVDA